MRKRLLVVALALIVLAELLSFLGIGAGARAIVFCYPTQGHAALSSALLASAALYAVGASRANRNAMLAVGLALEIGHALLLRDPVLALTNLGGGFGLAALVVAAIRRDRLLETALFPLYVLASALPIELTLLLHPHTIDARLGALDARIFGDHHALAGLELLRPCLPIAAGIVCVRKRVLQVTLLVATLVTLLLHHAMPAAGDTWSEHARTLVPSLSLTGSLLVYWHARSLGAPLRIAAALVVAVVALSETYFVGVLITLPIAAAIHVVVARVGRQDEASASSEPRPHLAIAAIFFASGFAGLLYEVVFAKALALVFGSTAVASTTVLATYMGGMALGAYVGGRIRVRSALRAYAFCELGVALSCALSPLLVRLVRSAYIAIASADDPGRPANVALQVGLGALVLLVPTVLMGMTMPILARYFEREDPTLGRSVALLYMANTAGAAFGAGLAGYFLLSTLGVRGSTIVGVVANVAVGLVALRRAKTSSSNENRGEIAAPPEDRGPRSLAWLGFAALGAGGLVSLGLEITYNHLLAIVVGNSTYAFSSMLATFLIGLAAGAAAGRGWLRAAWSVALGIGVAQAGLAGVVLLGVFAWNGVPDYFAGFAHFDVARTFAISELIRFVVCACLLLPPSFFVGMSYPIAIEAVVRGSSGDRERALGSGAATNTVGNIMGALVTAFVLVPRLGSLRTLHALAAIAFALAFGALAVSKARVLAGALAAAVVLAVLQPSSFDLDRLAAGSNVYFAPLARGRVIDSAEDIEGGLTTVCRSDDVTTLLTNGKFQGNDSATGEMRAQYGFTLLPLLHTAARGDALVIGFGTGVSALAVAEAGFEHVQVVELSRDIVEMSRRHFGAANGHVLERPNVSVSYTDGRNFLQLRDARYDLIGVEISSIWFAGAASLYNVEFYELAKRRLSEHGVFQQWIQLHHVDNTDIVSMLASVRAVFSQVWVYVAGGQGVVVACTSECPPTDESARTLAPAETDRLLRANASLRVESTDDNGFLEYHTPRGNIGSAEASYEQNLALIRAGSR